MQFRQAVLVADDRTYQLEPGKSNSFEPFFADFQCNPVPGEHLRKEGSQYSIFLHPKQDMTVQRLEIQFDIPLSAAARFLANGYQSGSETRWLPVTGSVPRLRRPAWGYFGRYGDDLLPGIPRGSGRLHSWTYTLLNDPPGDATFLGSLDESTGFTLFLYDRAHGVLTVRRDMEGLRLSHSFPTLNFVVLHGGEKNVYDAYYQLLGMEPGPVPILERVTIGWTSRLHSAQLSEAVLHKNLDAFAALYATIGQPEFGTEETGSTGLPAAFFQIDDGWQTAVGDWLSVNSALPADMGKVAALIREKQLLPAIWLAPFVASSGSNLVKKHPDWLLKDTKNKPLRVGWNPQWAGWFHALDFYHPGVQEWLAGVFHVVCERWNFEILKLDFLFAVCLAPPPGKTRGQVMYDAVQFLMELTGEKRFHAGSIPLGAALGFVDCCRFGADIKPVWESRFQAFVRRRERAAALPALRSILHRWRLQHICQIDPDVFVLQNDRQQLSVLQQHTVLTINVLFGNLLYTSDDIGEWSSEQIAEYSEAIALRNSLVRSVMEIQEDLYRIDFECRSDEYTAYCNLSGKTRNPVPDVVLSAYETIVLKA